MLRASAGLSDGLVADLQRDYSRQLYGQTGRVQENRLRIIWPSLLRPRVLRSLTSSCSVPERHKGQGGAQAHLWLHAPKNNLQTQGVWVHQPAEHLHSNHGDHEWVEVTHCYYSSEGVRSWTPMWFFAVPGSGLSVNIGRSLRLDGGPSIVAYRHAERLHKSIVKGNVPRFVNLSHACDDDSSGSGGSGGSGGNGGNGGGGSGGCVHEAVDLQAYDSVQFPLRAHNSWGAERWTEIVLLRGGHEASFVTQSPQLLRCGRHPFLRQCTLADAAVRMQGPGCIRSMAKHEAVVQVLRQSNCTVKLNVNAVAEGIADREVARLLRVCSRQRDALRCGADVNLTNF